MSEKAERPNQTMRDEHWQRLASGEVKLRVNEAGQYVATRTTVRVGLGARNVAVGRTPRMAIEALT